MKETGSHIISEALFSTVLNTVEESVVIIDSSRNVTFINKATVELLGKNENDVLHQSVDSILTFFPSDNFLFEHSLNTGKPAKSVRVLKVSDGKEFLVEVKVEPLFNSDGAFIGYCLLVKDVSEKENYTAELEKSTRRYRGLFENVREGIFVINGDGVVVDANPAASRIYDISKNELLNKNVGQFFPHKKDKESNQIWIEFLKKGRINGLYKFFTPSGETKYIEFIGKTNFIPGFHLAVFTDVTEKREVQKALRTSEEQLKAIFNSSSQRVILVDLNLKVLQINKNARRISIETTGKEVKPGDDLLEFLAVSPKKELTLQILKRVMEGEQIQLEVNPYNHMADYWVEVTLAPVFGAGKKVVSICISTMDISLRKKAELSLTESEARFRSLVQNSSDIIAIISSDHNIVYTSPSVANILGYKENGIVNIPIEGLLFSEDIDLVKTALKDAVSSGLSSKIEFRILHSEGYYVFVEAIINNQLENPYIKGIVINGRDISERKFQEESLLLLERAIDSSDNGIVITDPNHPDNPVIYANKAFEKITGYEYEEIVGKNCRILQGEDRSQPDIKKIRKAMREQKGTVARLRNYKKDGSIFWNDLIISPVFSRSGNLSNYIGVLNDFTERKLVEDTLLEINHGIAGLSEKDFYPILAKHLSYSLHAEMVMVGEVDGKDLKVRSFFKDGKESASSAIQMAGTPFGKVIQSGKPFFCADVNKQYPTSPWTEVEFQSFFGVPLVSSSGKALGILCVFSRSEFQNVELVESVLSLFSVRTSAELEREQNLSALQKSETKFRNLAENSPDIILIIDVVDNKVVYLNRRRAFGYRQKDLEQPDFLIDLVHPDDKVLVEKHWRRIMTGRESGVESVDYRVLKKNGQYEWIASRYTVIESDNGRAVKILLNLTIISERKKAEDGLKESENKLLALIENTTDLLWSVDQNLIFTTMNSAFRKMVRQNYGVNLKIGTSFEVLPEKIKSDWVVMHKRPLNGERFTTELDVEVASGVLSYEISFNPIWSDEGTISGVSVFARDITSRKIAENDIIRTNFELDSFVYRASHDLRAPLRSVLGLISLVKLEKQAPERNQYLTLVDKSIAKLDTFISDLTNFSRNSRLELSASKINFSLIIDECVDHLKFMDKAGSIKIKKNLKDKSPFYSDSTRLSIILQNLLSNAIKYQNEYLDDSYCKISVITREKEAEITISDNGKGIKGEYLDKIFNMFFRASYDSYGSGLGLYITKQAIEKMNGKISVNSTFGQGTEFKIILPNLK